MAMEIDRGAEGRQHEEASSPTTIHVLLLSFPVPSHLNPLIHLARKLFSFSASSSCSFVFTSIVSFHIASRTSSTSATDHGSFTLRTIAVPDGLPFSHPRSDFSHYVQACHGMRPFVEQFLPQLQQTHPPVSCIISDVFVPWSQEVASKFGIPAFAFFSFNASACCVLAHAPELISKGIIPFKANADSKQRITCPGAPELLLSELPPSMQAEDISSYRLRFILKIFELLEISSGLIFNTFYELETKAVNVLRNKYPVYTVGSLLLPSGDETLPVQHDVSFWPAEDRCLTWLDTQATSSVLYISFGSLSTFPDDESMRELALGLEASQQSFLWVIRQDAVDGSLSKVLPEGFLDRTRDRSLIISWAPQLLVFQHPAVGGFLSHCGWNSILENIALGGIPMLCWPVMAEQKLNARLLVDDWELGLEFCRKEDERVSHEEVERVVTALMQGEEGKERRKRGAELKSKAQKVVKQGGSSFKNIEALVKNMKHKMQHAASV